MRHQGFLKSETRSKAASLPPHFKFVVLAILLLFCATAAAQTKSSCINCHIKLEDPRLSAPAKAFDNDIHKSRGLSCNDCHGGDPNADSKEAAKDPRKGYLGKPKTLDIPAYCGKCHSDANLMKRFNPGLRVDQEREYYTSVHGKLLKEKRETRVATCNQLSQRARYSRAERSAFIRLSGERCRNLLEVSREC